MQTVRATQDADRQVALGVPGLLGVRRDRVEADVGEKDPRGPLGHAGPALVLVEERVPVAGIDVGRPHADDREDDADVEDDHRRVEARTLADADDQDRREHGGDHHRGQVEPGPGRSRPRRA